MLEVSPGFLGGRPPGLEPFDLAAYEECSGDIDEVTPNCETPGGPFPWLLMVLSKLLLPAADLSWLVRWGDLLDLSADCLDMPA